MNFDLFVWLHEQIMYLSFFVKKEKYLELLNQVYVSSDKLTLVSSFFSISLL